MWCACWCREVPGTGRLQRYWFLFPYGVAHCPFWCVVLGGNGLCRVFPLFERWWRQCGVMVLYSSAVLPV